MRRFRKISICGLFALLFMGLNLKAETQVAKGEMACKVTSNKVIESHDGLPREYLGYDQGVEVGEQLRFTYGANSVGTIAAELVDDFRAMRIWSTVVSMEFGASISVPSDGQLIANSERAMFHLKNDSLFGHNSFFGELSLHRYYKRDWHGVFVRLSRQNLSAHVMTLDCRTITDAISDVIEAMR